LLNGSALAVNWEQKNIPAIVEAWYPGQAAGQAIADVLFGDYNPGGKLPVTFYKSVKDLPAFDDYKTSGHTYRFFKGEPLYPFGYGLSYTTFAYDNLTTTVSPLAGDTVHVSVNVKNTGKVTGDEVVQLYIAPVRPSDKSPIRSLKGFERVRLKANESKKIDFIIPPDAFSRVNEKGGRIVSRGEFELTVGGGQPISNGAPFLKTTVTLH